MAQHIEMATKFDALRMAEIRAALGKDVVIMGHHYQSDDVMAYVDKAGDSLELARMVSAVDAQHIVFCGVHFMAESACLLASPDKHVHLPALDAACVMSDMVPAPLLDTVLARLNVKGRKVIPLAYVNTSLAVKAVVGRYGGAVCTSANAPIMLAWALAQGDAVLFLPDKNLGNNTADALNLPESARHTLDIRKNGILIDDALAARASLLLWPGCCAVHACFKPQMAELYHASHPDGRVLVHPECSPAMVQASDGHGSTSFLIREAENAPDGAHLAIGTEINLVRRLAARHSHRLLLTPLTVSACSNMAKVTPSRLLATLHAILSNTATPMTVEPSLTGPARDSLDRMLEQCQ